MVQRLQVVHHQRAVGQLRGFGHVGGIHEDFCPHIEPGPARRQHRHRRLKARQAVAHRGREHGVARQVDAGLARQLQQVAVAVLHEAAHPAGTVHTRDRRDMAAQRPRLARWPRQRPHQQAALRQVVGIAWHADHRNLPFAQKALASAVQVVEMAALAVRDEGVGHTLQQRIGALGQLHNGIALAPRAQIAQRGQTAPGGEHGVHQQAHGASLGLEFKKDGGVAQLGDLHGVGSEASGYAVDCWESNARREWPGLTISFHF